MVLTLTQPDDDLRAVLVDVTHQSDLVRALGDILLINTDSVDPYLDRLQDIPQSPQGRVEIGADTDGDSIAEDGSSQGHNGIIQGPRRCPPVGPRVG